MKIKILFPQADGRFVFTQDELEALLEESYQDGYNEGIKQLHTPIITYNPKDTHQEWWSNPYITTCSNQGV